VLSAVDPANPYGWLLPWPGEPHDGAQRPRRVAGARVVLIAGEPVLYLGPGGKQMLTFPAARTPDMLASAVTALHDTLKRHRGKLLRVEHIDGRPAQSSEWVPRLLALRFVSGYRGLELEA
jgi:ATP-dependent helicase Lhr and Lhr-like helicase